MRTLDTVRFGSLSFDTELRIRFFRNFTEALSEFWLFIEK